MTFAGKKLQDIYDSGSARLNELEESSTAKLTSKAAHHVNERQESEQQSKMEVAAKAAAVEEEIKRQAREAADRLKAAAEKERQTTETHLKQLSDRLALFSSDLKNAIDELKIGHESTLDDSFMRASDHYSSVVEGAAVDLETQHYVSGQRLRSQSSFFANSLQQKLDHSLWESRGSEKQSNSALFRNYMQKANSIESHFSTLMQRFNADFQNEFEKLEAHSNASDTDLELNSDTLNNKIDEILRSIEGDINEIFTTSSNNNKSALRSKFEGVCEQVEELSRDTSAQLRDDTTGATSRLTQASVASNQALKKKCEEVKEQVQMDMQAFVARMNGKVSETELVRAQLEEAKSRVINEIRSELIAIRNGFESKLGALMKEASASLASVGAEVDAEMKGAFDRSLSKIAADTQGAKKEIEDSTTKLVTMINEQKDNALKEIAHAAGVTD
jgi:hypothetical protein